MISSAKSCHPWLNVFLLSVCVAASSIGLQAQAFQREWVRTYSLDKGKTNMASSILSAPDGVIVAGSLQNEDGDADYFVVKYGLDGAELWRARHNSGVGVQDWFRAVTADPAGNVFVTGTSETVKYSSGGNFVWSAPFGGVALAVNNDAVYITGSSEVDWQTIKFENNEMDGQSVWNRIYNGPANSVDRSQVLTIGADGKVIVAGFETLVKPQVGPSMLALTSIGYDPDGNIAWNTRAFSQLSGISAAQVLAAPTGSFYVLGRADSLILLRFQSNGDLTWNVPIGVDRPGSFAFDALGNSIVVGYGTTQEGPDGGAVIKVAPDGSKPWPPYRILRGGGEASHAKYVSTDTNGNIFVAGAVNPSTANGKILLVKLSADLNLLGIDRYDSPAHLEDTATGIVIGEDGSVYVTGWSRTAEGGTEFVTIKYSAAPKIEQRADGAMRLEFYTSPGQRYGIEATSDFLNWQSLITLPADAGGVVRFDDTNAPAIPFRFYRGNSNP